MSEDGRPALADGAPGTGRRPAGALESEVLSILRESDVPLSPGEVRQLLAAAGHGDGPRGELSYSTVVTIVSRLHAKGLLTRNRAGRGFTYIAVDEAGLAASRMNRALGSGTDRTAVLSRFVSGLSERDARMLRDLLASDPGPPEDEFGPLGNGLGPAAGRE